MPTEPTPTYYRTHWAGYSESGNDLPGHLHVHGAGTKVVNSGGRDVAVENRRGFYCAAPVQWSSTHQDYVCADPPPYYLQAVEKFGDLRHPPTAEDYIKAGYADPELEQLLNEEEEIAQTKNPQDHRPKPITYDPSNDPISPFFQYNPDYWTPEKNPRDIMELFLPITKETIIGDVIVVPEHRCDVHDTQAQLASQFMAAYNIDSLKCHVYNGMTVTFRKVGDE